MKTLSWLAPFVVALSLAGCAQNPVTSLAPADGGFTVQMPGKVKEDAATKGTRMFLSEVDGIGFLVSYTDFGQRLKSLSPDQMLDAARNGMVSSKNKVISEEKINFEGRPGRDLRLITRNGFHMRLKLVLTETRLYQVGAAAPKDKASSPDIDQFIESFHFTGAH
ncbi:MAG TPA: hypothetical protein VIU46_03300 [Gallionellaceae bacterium]